MNQEMKNDRNKLIEDNLNLVWFVINKMNYKLDRDDQFQEGCLGLIKAADTYNPDLGFTFSTYACSLIESYLKGFACKEREASNISLDTEIGDNYTISDTISSDENIERSTTNKCLAEFIENQLEGIDKQIILLRYIEDKSVNEVANLLGKTPEYIRMKEHKALSKCRRLHI